jgi:hypothetical protein
VKPVINGGHDEAGSSGVIEGPRKAKNRPLFCVVCASNNVCHGVLGSATRLTNTESFNGSSYGAGVRYDFIAFIH